MLILQGSEETNVGLTVFTILSNPTYQMSTESKKVASKFVSIKA